MTDASNRPVVVVGGGGHAAEVVSYLVCRADAPVRVAAVVDEALDRSPFAGIPLLRDLTELERFAGDQDEGVGYHLAVGSNASRAALARRIEDLGVPGLVPTTVIASTAHPGQAVQVGGGTLLAPGSVVTTRSQLGRHCIVNVKASVAHDCRIGDFVNLNPASTVCGWATIGEGAFIGAGATVIDGVTIGAWTVLGAGAVAVADLPEGVVAVGVPAKPVRKADPVPAS